MSLPGYTMFSSIRQALVVVVVVVVVLVVSAIVANDEDIVVVDAIAFIFNVLLNQASISIITPAYFSSVIALIGYPASVRGLAPACLVAVNPPMRRANPVKKHCSSIGGLAE